MVCGTLFILFVQIEGKYLRKPSLIAKNNGNVARFDQPKPAKAQKAGSVTK